MKTKTLLFIITPMTALALFGAYYNNTFSSSHDYTTLKGIENQKLVNKLLKSLDPDWNTGLVGYETSVQKTAFHHIGQSDLFVRGPFNQTRYKPTSPEKAEEVIDVIKDYSIKLQTPCGTGTGWFLDYVLPEDGSYPTEWFIATNAHVIEGISFEKNPFNQNLPKRKGKGCVFQDSKFSHTPLVLVKEKSIDLYEADEHQEARKAIKKADQYPEYWPEIKKQIVFIPEVQLMNVSKEEERNGDDRYLFFYENSPKLFYVAVNYLGSQLRELGYSLKRNNYYKDFAVLYVDFKNSEIAEAITRNFFAKYDYKNGSEKGKALNFFSPELISTKTSDQLIEDATDYFVAGYSVNGIHPFRSSGNYSARIEGASRLTFMRIPDQRFALRNKFGSPIIGHVNVGVLDEMEGPYKTTVTWRGWEHTDWGYNYLLDNSHLTSGASGSITMDKNGNVLGLYRMHDPVNKHSFVEPLRSKGIYKKGKIIYPSYDLIEGTEEQLSSYKSQIVEYCLKKNKQTALSTLREWRI